MERVCKTTRVWGYDNLYPSLSRCTAMTGKTTRVWDYGNLYLSLSRSIANTGHQTCRNEPDAAILEYYKMFELSLPLSLSRLSVLDSGHHCANLPFVWSVNAS